jgi:hypothetical protein
MRGLLIVPALAALALAATLTTTDAAGPDRGLTFDGPAGEGTISLTLTSDRTGVQQAAIDAVFPSPIPEGSPTRFAGVTYYSPPLPVTDGAVAVSVFDLSNPLAYRQGAVIDGTIDSPGELTGSAQYCGLIPPGTLVCTAAVQWSATGPEDTPPSAADVVIEGETEGAPGRVTITLDPDGRGVTSIGLEAVGIDQCIQAPNPLDVFAFFRSPLSLTAGGDAFDVTLALNGANRLSIAGGPQGEGGMSGTVSYSDFFGTCHSELAWRSEPGEPAPTPAPTAVGPAELPSTGAGAPKGGDASLAAYAAAGLIAMAGALALRRARRGARRG